VVTFVIGMTGVLMAVPPADFGVRSFRPDHRRREGSDAARGGRRASRKL